MPSTPQFRRPLSPLSSSNITNVKIGETSLTITHASHNLIQPKKLKNSSPLLKSRPSHKRIFHSPRKERRTFFQKLDAIREESPTPNRIIAPSHRFRDIRNNSFVQEDPYEDAHHMDTDSDDSFFWEEENTLLTELMDEGTTRRDEDAKAISLIESMQDSFDEEGVKLKKEIAHAFVPTVKYVKEQFQAMEKSVDAPFGDGLIKFNNACKKIELHFLEEYDQLKEAYTASKKRMDAILEQLEKEYKHRDELWENLETSIRVLADPVLKELQETPENVERTITRLEKERKAMEADTTDTTLAKQKFKELLSLMT